MKQARTVSFIERWYPNYHLSSAAAVCSGKTPADNARTELKIKMVRCRLFFDALKNYIEHMEAAM